MRFLCDNLRSKTHFEKKNPRVAFKRIRYVVPTRVRRIEDLYFDKMYPHSRFCSMAKTKVFAERKKLKEKKNSDEKYAEKARLVIDLIDKLKTSNLSEINNSNIENMQPESD